MLEVHISNHSLFRLKITVGCLVCACGVCGVCVCVCVVVCTCGVVYGVGGVCVVVLWWCVCVVCGEAWHTLSLVLKHISKHSLFS